MYQKLSGMTGTAKTEEEEFKGIYQLDVVQIPTNRPMIRKDMNDLVYRTVKGKFSQVVEEIERRHKTGQPVLVGHGFRRGQRSVVQDAAHARHRACRAEREVPCP